MQFCFCHPSSPQGVPCIPSPPAGRCQETTVSVSVCQVETACIDGALDSVFVLELTSSTQCVVFEVHLYFLNFFFYYYIPVLAGEYSMIWLFHVCFSFAFTHQRAEAVFPLTGCHTWCCYRHVCVFLCGCIYSFVWLFLFRNDMISPC